MKRDSSVDTLRGVAITLMIASHIVWFLSTGESKTWNFMRSWGDAVSFITFLFIFGISAYFSIFTKDYSLDLVKKVLKRTFGLLIIYYFLAVISSLKSWQVHFTTSSVLKVLILSDVPGFVEFLLPFLFFLPIVLLLKKYNLERRLFTSKNSGVVILTVGLLSWFIGTAVAFINTNVITNDTLKRYIALVAGGHVLRFPLLQYFPALLLGLYFGYLIKEGIEEKFKRNLITFTVSFLFFSLVLWGSELLFQSKQLNFFTRWPPSLLFLCAGLSFALISLWIIRLKKLIIYAYFERVGLLAVPLLVFHLVVLRVLELFNYPKLKSPFLLFFWFIIVLNSVVIFVFLRNKVGREHV